LFRRGSVMEDSIMLIGQKIVVVGGTSGDEREAKLRAKATSDLLTARASIPDDAAKSYLYAICNPYLTGQTIVVDGGGSLT
jgi:hypothetical protein